jgi:lambda family phage portal protein
MWARQTLAMLESYRGGSRSRRQTVTFNPFAADADTDLLPDLQMLRTRSRALVRNNALATGAIDTNVLNVVGSGLKLNAQLDRDIVPLGDEEAAAWEAHAEREWRLFFETSECDAARTLTGHELAALTFRAALENGDSFTLLPRFLRGDSPYALHLQVIEADRICNANDRADAAALVAGVQKDEQTGAPEAYHIMRQHPGNLIYFRNRTWDIVAARDQDGVRNILHHYRVKRPGQTRGVPYLAPVIEQLKQIERLTDAELMASVVASMFTVFVRSQTGQTELDSVAAVSESTPAGKDRDYRLGSGAIVHLAENESIEIANPTRPNASFEPFFLAITRQIGIALGIPYEVLIKHFEASYSASRAALLEAWKQFLAAREWLAASFYQPIYETFLYEAVVAGRLEAPGFFSDPLLRQAWCTAQWTGSSQDQIDPEKEARAAEKRLELGLTTRTEETMKLTGGDFNRNIAQIAKEMKLMQQAGISPGARHDNANSTDSNDSRDATEDEDADS